MVVGARRYRVLPTLAIRISALVAAVIILVACSPAPEPSADPSPTVAPAAGYALACWDTAPDDCERIAAEGIAQLPVAPPAAVQVAFGGLAVELAGGAGRFRAAWSLEPGEPVVFGPWEEEPFVVVRPSSGPLLGLEAPFDLGHCGLGSPIDVDGAFWDPHGPVDAQATEAINATSGTFRRAAPGAAEFVAPSGFRVGLLRHQGPKAISLCD